MKIIKTGFIGCGNMASAIIDGILLHRLLDPEHLFVYDIENEKCKKFDGVTICASIEEAVEQSDIVFLCTKPNVINSIAKKVNIKHKAFVSIAAGITSDYLKEILPVPSRIMRIMPNTPMMVGKGTISIEEPTSLTEGEEQFVYNVLSQLGHVAYIDKHLMDAVTAISGSGPAYVYLFVDALSQAGQAEGLDEDVSYELALRTFEGAIAMLISTDKRPQQLIEDVCSPGGTTIEAMKVFEKRNICATIQEAVEACVNRSKELSD